LLNNIATIHDVDIKSKSPHHVEDNFSTYNNHVVGGNRSGGETYADDEESEGGALLFIHTPERKSWSRR